MRRKFRRGGPLIVVFSEIEVTVLAGLLDELDDLAADPEAADHICRLCDETACPPARCPVHRQALALEKPQ